MQPTQNRYVVAANRLITPRELNDEIPETERANLTVVQGRNAIERILAGNDSRLFAVVGPCSIHDPAAAIEYAQRLAALAEKVSQRIVLIMRVYFEKPRTTLGWKGLINDPHLDDTFDVAEGLRIARRLLIKVAEMGLPAATEMLEPITPRYISGLITLASIGARTTESPTHRQMASGLSMPVGFKNNTEGALDTAVNAMHAANHPHRFLGIDMDGRISVVETMGNPWAHLIVRGGRSGPNYDEASLACARAALAKSQLLTRLVVDCSHANSNKDYARQGSVWRDVIRQRVAGNGDIAGLMLESNLHAGRQELGANPKELAYGVSITDGCISFDETEDLVMHAYEQLSNVMA